MKLREAQGGAEQQRTELTRARAEVLQLRQELAESTQQLLMIGRAQGAEEARQRSGAGGAPAGCLLEGPSGASSEGGGGLSQEVQETLAARLATAQVRKQPVLQAKVLNALQRAVPKLLRPETIGVDPAHMSLTLLVLLSVSLLLLPAQVLKREAEDRAAELSRKLATAQSRLAEMQQQADDSEADMGSQLYQAQAQVGPGRRLG